MAYPKKQSGPPAKKGFVPFKKKAGKPDPDGKAKEVVANFFKKKGM